MGCSLNSHMILKKNKLGGLTSPNFKTCYKAVVIKTKGTGVKTDLQTDGRVQT